MVKSESEEDAFCSRFLRKRLNLLQWGSYLFRPFWENPHPFNFEGGNFTYLPFKLLKIGVFKKTKTFPNSFDVLQMAYPVFPRFSWGGVTF